MKRTALLIFAIVLVGALIFTGCAQPSPAPSPSPAPAPAPAPAPSPSAAPAPAPKPAPAPSPAPAPAPAKVYKFRFQAFYPPTEQMLTVGLVEMVKRVKEATKGAVEITVYAGGQLVPAAETFKSVSEGIVEMGLSSASYHAGFMPFTVVPDGMPMSFRKPDDTLKFLREFGFADFMQTEYEKRGNHFLGGAIETNTGIISRKPIKTKADFQGLKMRGFGLWNSYFKLLGASPVDVPLTDVYLGLSMGTFDTATTGSAAFYSLKHYEVAKYLVQPYLLGATVHDIYINLKTWNSLPADIKTAMTNVFLDFEKWHTTYFYENYVSTYTGKLVEKGVQKVEVDADTLVWMTQKAQELWDESAKKDETANKAVTMMKDYFKKQGYLK